MRKGQFESLICKWQQAGKITTEQASYMKQDLNETISEHSGKQFIHVIGILGASALAVGVLLMISANWSQLGKTFQLFLAVLLPLIPILIAYKLLCIENSQSIWGRVTNVLGMVLIAGTLAIIGQVYHLETNLMGLLWSWATLSAPLVVLFRRSENVVIFALLVAAALFSSLVEWLDTLVNEQVMLLTYTIGSLFYAALLFSLSKISASTKSWLSATKPLQVIGLGIATITLFFATFEFYAREILALPYTSTAWVPLSVILNVIFIGFMLALLVRAFRVQDEQAAFAVIRLLGIYIMVKYFTLFSDLLETGALLTIGGLFFVLGAWYLERNKSPLLALLKNQVGEPV